MKDGHININGVQKPALKTTTANLDTRLLRAYRIFGNYLALRNWSGNGVQDKGSHYFLTS